MRSFRPLRSCLPALALLTAGFLIGPAALSACGGDSSGGTPGNDDGGGNGGDSGHDAWADGGLDGSQSEPPDGARDAGGDTGTGGGCQADIQNDSKNCGACGHDCLGAKCTAAACEPQRISDAVGPTASADAVVVDDTSVYWLSLTTVSGKTTSVVRAGPKGGGTSRIVGTADAGERWFYTDLVLFNGTLYTGIEDAFGLRSVPAAGGAVTHVLDAASSPLSPYHFIDVGFGYFYVADACSIFDVPLPKGAAGSIQRGTCGAQNQGGLAIDATTGAHVYMTFDRNTIWKVTTANTDPNTNTQIIQASNDGPLVTDATRVYWTSPAGVQAMPISGGSATILAARPGKPAQQMRVDAQGVYWRAESGIVEAQFGKAPLVLYPSVSSGLAVDRSYVYYTTNGAVWRIAK